MDQGKTVIEINGVKLEVDLRHAKRIDEIRVGDRVKVLIKTYSDYAVKPGVVIGFEPFQNLPTIIVAYLDGSWQSSGIKFAHFNAQSKDTEIVKAIDDDAFDLDKGQAIAALDRKIAECEAALKQAREYKQYFLDNFRAYWERPVVPASTDPF